MNEFKNICEKCGEDMTGRGIIAWVEHPCNVNTIEYRGALPDDEMRESMMHMGMPSMVYELFGYAAPSPMERKIYEDTSPYRREEPVDPFQGLRESPAYQRWIREFLDSQKKDDLS